MFNTHEYTCNAHTTQTAHSHSYSHTQAHTLKHTPKHTLLSTHPPTPAHAHRIPLDFIIILFIIFHSALPRQEEPAIPWGGSAPHTCIHTSAHLNIEHSGWVAGIIVEDTPLKKLELPKALQLAIEDKLLAEQVWRHRED